MHWIKPNSVLLNMFLRKTIKDPGHSNLFFVEHFAVFVVFLILPLKFFIIGCLIGCRITMLSNMHESTSKLSQKEKLMHMISALCTDRDP